MILAFSRSRKCLVNWRSVWTDESGEKKVFPGDNDFLYEKDGQKGLWLVVVDIKKQEPKWFFELS